MFYRMHSSDLPIKVGIGWRNASATTIRVPITPSIRCDSERSSCASGSMPAIHGSRSPLHCDSTYKCFYKCFLWVRDGATLTRAVPVGVCLHSNGDGFDGRRCDNPSVPCVARVASAEPCWLRALAWLAQRMLVRGAHSAREVGPCVHLAGACSWRSPGGVKPPDGGGSMLVCDHLTTARVSKFRGLAIEWCVQPHEEPQAVVY